MYLCSYGREERFRPGRGRPTVATGETRGKRKPHLSMIDPGGVDHQQRFQKDWWTPARGPFRAVDFDLRGLPPTATIGSPLRGLLQFTHVTECLRRDFQ